MKTTLFCLLCVGCGGVQAGPEDGAIKGRVVTSDGGVADLDPAPAADLSDVADDAVAPDMACSVTHSNGTGQTWIDCVPLGTYNEAQALKACMALAALEPEGTFTCKLPAQGNVCAGVDVGGDSTTTPAADNYSWVYAGTYQGLAVTDGCTTPITSVAWN